MANTRQSQKSKPSQSSKIEWFPLELNAWKPPEKLLVSDWADKHRILDAKTSSSPGKWKTDHTPYLREPMNAFNEKGVEEIYLCCGSQLGKTEALNNICGYTVDQDPTPTLIVYPTKDLAEFASENRIQPMLESSPVLAAKFKKNQSDRYELQFEDMYIALIGANSPSALASRPIGRLLMDETDKFPPSTAKEADAISLAKERTKTFYNKKIFMASTPTLEIGQIWTHLMGADVVKQYFVSCPHCGEIQTLKNKQIHWPPELNSLPVDERAKMARHAARYVCEHCGCFIEDRDKQKMLKGGQWLPVKYDRKTRTWSSVEYPKRKITKVGYQLNSIYSPWLTFGEIAEKFLLAKENPDELRNFVNSWLGEPWFDESNPMQSSIVLQKQWSHKRGTVPDEAIFLTAGIDVQKDHFWYTVRAWGPKVTSWNVDYERVETWDEIEEMLYQEYRNSQGKAYWIKLALMDSGYNADEVYAFCASHPEVCWPSKGSSEPLTAPYKKSTIDKVGFHNLILIQVDTGHYKDFISGRLTKNPGEPGAWMVFENCPQEYADHITSEQKVTHKVKRKVKTEWVPIGSHPMNHLLDCEVYAAAAADLAGVRYLYAEQSKLSQKPKRRTSETQNHSNNGDWIQDVNW